MHLYDSSKENTNPKDDTKPASSLDVANEGARATQTPRPPKPPKR